VDTLPVLKDLYSEADFPLIITLAMAEIIRVRGHLKG